MPQPPELHNVTWAHDAQSIIDKERTLPNCGLISSLTVHYPELVIKQSRASPQRMPLLPVSQQCPSPNSKHVYLHRTPIKVSGNNFKHTHSSPITSCNSSQGSQEDTGQWVIAGDILDDSFTPDVLHVCEHCDSEFFAIKDLLVHSRICVSQKARIPSLTKPTQFLQINPFVDISKNHDTNFNILTSSQRTTQYRTKLYPSRKSSVTHNFLENKYSLNYSKNQYLKGLGLYHKSGKLCGSKHTNKDKKKLSKRASLALVCNVPLTLLPQLQANMSFLDAQHANEITDQLKVTNWINVDKVCPAYPENHRKFVNFVELRSPMMYNNVKRKKPKERSSHRIPRLILHKLTPHDIQLATKGVQTHAIIKKYSTNSKQLSRRSNTKIKTAQRAKRSRPLPTPAPKRGKNEQQNAIEELCVEVSNTPAPELSPGKCIPVEQPTTSVVSEKGVPVVPLLLPFVRLERLELSKDTQTVPSLRKELKIIEIIDLT